MGWELKIITWNIRLNSFPQFYHFQIFPLSKTLKSFMSEKNCFMTLEKWLGEFSSASDFYLTQITVGRVFVQTLTSAPIILAQRYVH